VTANTADDAALLKRFGLFGPPGIIFFDAAGRELNDLRVVGFQPAETFLPTLERVLR
jgi:thiol:disulfide interchange protein DsbD